MTWKAVAITLSLLLGTALIAAAGLVVYVHEQRFDPRTDKRSDNPNWRDIDEPYRGPSGTNEGAKDWAARKE